MGLVARAATALAFSGEVQRHDFAGPHPCAPEAPRSAPPEFVGEWGAAATGAALAARHAVVVVLVIRQDGEIAARFAPTAVPRVVRHPRQELVGVQAARDVVGGLLGWQGIGEEEGGDFVVW